MENLLNIFTSHALAQTTVYDNRDKVVFQQFGQQHAIPLQNGIYTVRAELGSQLKEQTVLLRDQSEKVDLQLEYFSTAPLRVPSSQEKVVVTSHEYYTDGIEPLLRSAPNTPDYHSQVLNQFRYSPIEHYRKYNPLTGILNEVADEPLAQLAKNLLLFRQDTPFVSKPDWRLEGLAGSLTYCDYQSGGLYYLAYSGGIGGKSRLLPVYLFDGWTTLVFITLGAEPLFSSMRVMMAPIGQFSDPSDRELFAMDYAADQFQNNRYRLTKEVAQTMLQGKFMNPLLGILFAYAALLGEDRTQDQTVQAVLHNLRNEISINAECPGIEVLSHMASQRSKTAYKPRSFNSPPMVRASMKWLINAAIKEPELLPENSLICQHSPDVLADNVWTSWQAAPDLIRSLLPAGSRWDSFSLSSNKNDFEATSKSAVSWAEVGFMQMAGSN